MYEKLPSSFEVHQEIFNQELSTLLNEGYFDLQGMMIPDSSQDNGKISNSEENLAQTAQFVTKGHQNDEIRQNT